MNIQVPVDATGDHNHRLRYYVVKEGMETQPEDECQDYTKIMVMASGTFSVGSVGIYGSFNGVDYELLTDYDGVPLVFSTNGLKSSDDRVRFIKAGVIGGDELTAIKLGILLCR